MCFKGTNAGAVVTTIAKPYAQRTPNEIANQQRMKDARQTFKQLSTADLTLWRHLAALKGVSAWVYFFKIYQQQNVDTPNAPLIPEITIR